MTRLYRLYKGRYGFFVMIWLLLLGGCAKPGLYYWGEYEASLGDRYIDNNPAPTEERLRTTIVEAEKRNQKIPPGVNADYGFLLFTRGDKAGAISYFEKEKQLYPESAALMLKLIDKINQKSKEVEQNSTSANHPELKQ